MNVRLNGSDRALAEDATVADAVAVFTTAATGVAVAVNGEVVPRGAWSGTALRDGDRVEVLTAAQGG
ncbi:MAG TPA: sulfur carrier protein ThiS [Micromonosporaceae bacterium]